MLSSFGCYKLEHRVVTSDSSHTRNSQFLHAFIGFCNIFWWSKVWFWNKFFDICSSPRSRICPHGFFFDIRLLSFIALISTSNYIFLVDVLKLLWAVNKLQYRVTHQLESYLSLTSKQKFQYTKMQLLLWCQQRIGLEVMGHPVQTTHRHSLVTHNTRSKKYLKLKLLSDQSYSVKVVAPEFILLHKLWN